MLLTFTTINKPSILIVEDNLYFKELLSKILSVKYKVSSASNGIEALLVLKQNKMPHLVLTDMNMPLMNGYELINNLKKSGLYNLIPICIMTANDAFTIKQDINEDYIEAVFTKPFDPVELMHKLDLIVKRSTSEQLNY